MKSGFEPYNKTRLEMSCFVMAV